MRVSPENYLPSPKGEHETEPGEQKDTTMKIDGVEHRDAPGLPSDWVDLRGLPQLGDLKTHLEDVLLYSLLDRFCVNDVVKGAEGCQSVSTV